MGLDMYILKTEKVENLNTINDYINANKLVNYEYYKNSDSIKKPDGSNYTIQEWNNYNGKLSIKDIPETISYYENQKSIFSQVAYFRKVYFLDTYFIENSDDCDYTENKFLITENMLLDIKTRCSKILASYEKHKLSNTNENELQLMKDFSLFALEWTDMDDYSDNYELFYIDVKDVLYQINNIFEITDFENEILIYYSWF